MTRSFNAKIYCPRCGHEHTQESSFERWMRESPELDSRSAGLVRFDCDVLLHRYSLISDKKGRRDVQCLMFVEVKTFDAEVTKAQRDTLSLFNQVLRNRRCNMHSKKHGRHADDHVPMATVFSFASNRQIRLKMFGGHLLQMSGIDPDTSQGMMWDWKHPINHETLVRLLRFEIDPDTMQPIDWRRRYSAFKPPKQLF